MNLQSVFDSCIDHTCCRYSDDKKEVLQSIGQTDRQRPHKYTEFTTEKNYAEMVSHPGAIMGI